LWSQNNWTRSWTHACSAGSKLWVSVASLPRRTEPPSGRALLDGKGGKMEIVLVVTRGCAIRPSTASAVISPR
jgi:hypothetical protein